jgi:hypothetical protein
MTGDSLRMPWLSRLSVVASRPFLVFGPVLFDPFLRFRSEIGSRFFSSFMIKLSVLQTYTFKTTQTYRAAVRRGETKRARIDRGCLIILWLEQQNQILNLTRC